MIAHGLLERSGDLEQLWNQKRRNVSLIVFFFLHGIVSDTISSPS